MLCSKMWFPIEVLEGKAPNEGGCWVFKALNAFVFMLSTNMHYRRVRNSFALDVSGLKKCFAKACPRAPYVWRCFLSPTSSAMKRASSGSFSTTRNQTPRSLVSRVLSWFRSSLRTIHQHRLQSLLHHKPCPHHRPHPKKRRSFSLQDTPPSKRIITEPRLLLRSARHPPWKMAVRAPPPQRPRTSSRWLIRSTKSLGRKWRSIWRKVSWMWNQINTHWIKKKMLKNISHYAHQMCCEYHFMLN